VRDRLIILEDLQIWNDEFAAIEQSTVCQITPQARLGAAFSIFFYVVLRAITVLTIRPPEVKVADMKPVFDGMLAAAHRLRQLKLEVNMANQWLVEYPTEQV
jgi:hypothetical protein